MRRAVKDDVAGAWREFRRTRAKDARNRLIEHYMPLVQKVAEIMARRLWPRVTADELASAGYDGLIAAVNGFDTSRGVKFETYCRQRIIGAIRDWQREIDPLGRSGRSFERALNSAEERFQAERGRAPTSIELAAVLGLPYGKYLRLKKTVLASHCISLEQPTDRCDDGRATTLMPTDNGPCPTNHTERELVREYLTRGLKEHDRLIIALYYYEKMTMAEIGAVLGVSESRVCQRHAEILEQLRARFAHRSCDLVA
jgi:RNA polymerase sigma factor for flagellar operon FliA